MNDALVESGLVSALGGLSPLRDKDRQRVGQYLRDAAAGLSAYGAPSLFIWEDLFKYYWAVVDDHLCLFARYGGNYYMPLPPLGKGFSEAAVAESFSLMEHLNSNPGVSRIENVEEESAGFFSRMGFKIRPTGREYLYRREALVTLKGDAFKSKRWAINRFLKARAPVFEPYRREYLAECLGLFSDWRITRQLKFSDSYYRALLEDASFAHRRAMEMHEELGLEGRVLKIDGRIKGYTFGFEMNPQVYCVLLEVADLETKGAGQYLFWRFCQELEPYTHINVLDDSGLENLRRVKESYRPEKYVSSYAVYRA